MFPALVLRRIKHAGFIYLFAFVFFVLNVKHCNVSLGFLQMVVVVIGVTAQEPRVRHLPFSSH